MPLISKNFGRKASNFNFGNSKGRCRRRNPPAMPLADGVLREGEGHHGDAYDLRRVGLCGGHADLVAGVLVDAARGVPGNGAANGVGHTHAQCAMGLRSCANREGILGTNLQGTNAAWFSCKCQKDSKTEVVLKATGKEIAAARSGRIQHRKLYVIIQYD